MTIHRFQTPDGVIHRVEAPTREAAEAELNRALGIKPDAGKDSAKSFGSGLMETVAGQMDAAHQVTPLGMAEGVAKAAPKVVAAVKGGDWGGAVKAALFSPSTPYTDRTSPYEHEPQTTQGEWARTAGRMAPNIFSPGSLVRRAAAWAVPTLTTEAAGQSAKALGADERGQAAARVVGAVGGAGVASVRPGNIFAPKAARPDIVPALRAEKDAAYQAVDKSGARYAAGGLKGLFSEIDATAQANNINPQLHPRASAMLADLKARRNSMSLTELDQLRQVVRRDVVNRGDEAEAFFGKQMIAAIDQFIDSASGKLLNTGSGPQAAETISAARGANTQYRKAEAVTDAVEAARLRASSTGTGGNADNAIRQNLRRVLEETANLTPEERAVLQTAVKGGPVQNALRIAGKLSPTSGAMPLMASLGGAGLSGGKTLALSAAGYGAKLAADAITTQNVDKVLQVIASGSKAEQQQALQALELAAQREPQLRQAYQQALIRAGVAGSAVAIPSAASAEEQPQR